MTDLPIHEIEEIWKPIPGYEGYYEASSLGRIKGLSRLIRGRQWPETIRAPMVTSFGYLRVNLNKESVKKNYMIHRLILLSFVGPSDLCVDHRNGDPADNRLENLEYVSKWENARRGKGANGELYIKKFWNKWRVQTTINGKTVGQKSFFNKEEAYVYRDILIRQYNLPPITGVKNTDFK